MDKELKAKWVAALRSGDYRQATGRFEKDGGFCCLGVLCKVAGIPLSTDQPPKDYLSAGDNYSGVRVLGLDESSYMQAYRWNDDERRTFPEIADLIETRF